jgi:hypothetical protein
MASAASRRARSLNVVESVRWYEMMPSWKSRCAAFMVRSAENPSLRFASCCRVEVVNGAYGAWVAGRSSTEVTDHGSTPFRASRSLPAVCSSSIRTSPSLSSPVAGSKSLPVAIRVDPTRTRVAAKETPSERSRASRFQ